MKRSRRTRLFLEPLERRCFLSVTANVLTDGSLLIAADSPVKLEVSQTAAGEFSVANDGSPVGAGTYAGVTGNLKILLRGNNDDQVAVDLGGRTTPGSVVVYLGGANADTASGGTNTNTLLIENGTIAGSLTVVGGTGSDVVTLGGDATAQKQLTVNGSVSLALAGGADQVTLVGGSRINGNLATALVEQVNLSSGSTVGHQVLIAGSTDGNTVQVDGSIGGSLSFMGSSRSDKVDTLSIGSGAVISGNLIAHLDAMFGMWGGGNDAVNLDGKVNGLAILDTGRGNDTVSFNGEIGKTATVLLGAGDDQFNLTGKIDGALVLDAGAGNDTVNLNEGSQVAKNAYVLLGAGDDALTFAGTLGTATAPAILSIYGGAGADAVNFASALVLNGRAIVDLGTGDDNFVLAQEYAGPALNAFINGGSGMDTFTGNRDKIANNTTRIVGFELPT